MFVDVFNTLDILSWKWFLMCWKYFYYLQLWSKLFRYYPILLLTFSSWPVPRFGNNLRLLSGVWILGVKFGLLIAQAIFTQPPIYPEMVLPLPNISSVFFGVHRTFLMMFVIWWCFSSKFHLHRMSSIGFLHLFFCGHF
jgi:hypothetical protein